MGEGKEDSWKDGMSFQNSVARQNTGCPVKFEFSKNEDFFYYKHVLNITWDIFTLKSVCCLSEIHI